MFGGMETCLTICQTREAIDRRAAARVVLVPTMGALHAGHAGLIEEARALAGEDGLVVVSVFVNPTQFGPQEDFSIYPRTLEADTQLCEEAGADIVFAPTAAEMYAGDASIKITEGLLSRYLCGESRPGHFSGVCTVVAKLFNIVQPDIAVFGKKDRQQLAIIGRLTRDLNFPVEIIGIDTVREDDGVAMSSRNRFLDDEQRAAAPRLRHGMLLAADACFHGERSADALAAIVEATLAPCHFARVDYIEIVDAETMQPLELVDRPAVLAAAVFFGQTRLIDNIDLDPTGCFGDPAAAGSSA